MRGYVSCTCRCKKHSPSSAFVILSKAKDLRPCKVHETQVLICLLILFLSVDGPKIVWQAAAPGSLTTGQPGQSQPSQILVNIATGAAAMVYEYWVSVVSVR